MTRLVCIVGGVDVEVLAPRWSTFEFVVLSALLEAESTGRPESDYHARDENGVTMPTGIPLERFHLSDGDRFYVMPYVGAGGSFELLF